MDIDTANPVYDVLVAQLVSLLDISAERARDTLKLCNGSFAAAIELVFSDACGAANKIDPSSSCREVDEALVDKERTVNLGR